MQCVLVTKAAYQSLAWPVPFSKLVARAESNESGFAVADVSTSASEVPKGSVAFRTLAKTDTAYLYFQNW